VRAGRDIEAGRDIAGRDVVSHTTYIGFSQEHVLRLVLAVGGLVFITAVCFFTGGVAVGAGVFEGFQREVNSSPEAAESMQEKLLAIQDLPPNQPFEVTLTEAEISSYFRFIVGPEVGVENGRARLISEDTIALRGELRGVEFIATFQVQDKPGEALRLRSAAVRVFGSDDGGFGWVAVPRVLLEPLARRINEFLGRGFRVVAVDQPQDEPPAWEFEGVTIE
jgi:hypothetical protein